MKLERQACMHPKWLLDDKYIIELDYGGNFQPYLKISLKNEPTPWGDNKKNNENQFCYGFNKRPEFKESGLYNWPLKEYAPRPNINSQLD